MVRLKKHIYILKYNGSSLLEILIASTIIFISIFLFNVTINKGYSFRITPQFINVLYKLPGLQNSYVHNGTFDIENIDMTFETSKLTTVNGENEIEIVKLIIKQDNGIFKYKVSVLPSQMKNIFY